MKDDTQLVGLYAEIAGWFPGGASSGEAVARVLRQNFAGQMIYFPSDRQGALEARNARIREEFDGTNYNELARRHSMSVSNVRRIVGPVHERPGRPRSHGEADEGPRVERLKLF